MDLLLRNRSWIQYQSLLEIQKTAKNLLPLQISLPTNPNDIRTFSNWYFIHRHFHKLQLNTAHKTIVMGLINVYLLYFNTKRTTHCVQLRLLEMLWLVNGIFKMKLVPCEIWSNFLFSWLSDFLHHIHQLIYLPVYHCTNDFSSSSSFLILFISSNSLLYEMCFFFDFILAWSIWNCFPVILFALLFMMFRKKVLRLFSRREFVD